MTKTPALLRPLGHAIMALNWTMLSPNRSPVPLPDEMTVTTVDTAVDLSLLIPDSVPTGNDSAGGSGGSRKLKALGKIWLTDQRVCVLSSEILWLSIIDRLCTALIVSNAHHS